MTEFYDVCIVGAGPAGTSIANRLADFGYNVVLIEKQSFPRSHIGLSLTPGIRHWLSELNIEEKVKDLNFERALKSIVLWTAPTPIIKDFDAEKAGFHIDRGAFDSLLVSECKQKGVIVYQPATLKNLHQTENGSWSMKVHNAAVPLDISTRFLVDASGRNAVLKGTKTAYQPKLFATYSYWNGSESRSNYSFIEAGGNHWYWGAPLKNGSFVSCVFSDVKALQESESPERFYDDLIANSLLGAPLLENKKRSAVYTCDATAYFDTEVIGENFIKIGDAAFTMDPLSSQGVQKAIKSGIQGAIVVNTLLKKSNSNAALKFYENLIQDEVKKNKRWTEDFYFEQNALAGGSFWQSRKVNNSGIQPSSEEVLSLKKTDRLVINPKGKFQQVPILAVDFVDETAGFRVEKNESPFVYVEGIHIVTLIREISGKTAQECIVSAGQFSDNVDGFKLIQFLLFHGILVRS